MATLQQVHLKIQEISKEYANIPIQLILGEFEPDSEIAKHLVSLIHLAFIDFSYYKHGEIKLTETGRLANIPTEEENEDIGIGMMLSDVFKIIEDTENKDKDFDAA